MDTGQTKLAMTISTLGWILLVVAVGLFFLVGKPHYYEQGANDQREVDIVLVDQFLNGTVGALTPFSGEILEISDAEIIIQAENVTPNPLVQEEDQQRVIFTIDSDTVYTLQGYMDPVEYQALVEEALSQSDQENFVPPEPYIELPQTVEDLAVGDYVTIEPRSDAVRTDETIRAKAVRKFRFTDAQGNQVSISNPDLSQQTVPNTGVEYDPGPPQEFDLAPITE